MRVQRSSRETTGTVVTVLVVVAGLLLGGLVLTSPRTDAAIPKIDHSKHGIRPDPAQEAALLAQAAAPVRGSEFRADCVSSHRAGDDPIVYPNQPGVSHIHEFFGNRTANARSTLQSLAAGTTNCDPRVDLSSYWTPTLYQNGQPVPPERVTVYYQGITEPQRAVPPPLGLRYVVGNALAKTAEENPHARWSCLGASESSRDFLVCPPGSKLQTYLDFPTCWDGVRLDSPNHRDHVIYASGGLGGTCPASHPTPIPRVQFLITYPVTGGGLSLAGTVNGVNLTTARGFTFHGDFFNAWQGPELQRRVRDCINAGYICGTDGKPVQQ
ncbi:MULTISPECIES: DUF1996 domain-containing protein [unclassified Crossiella]|uniref:DUF1996 domain-containing protein n=1 Tax=unclassified Crossiella TaxID=2620835 RepID=UPI001FFE39CF|nr:MULTISPECIES: DUF1996 domain-containing protein [unclassified Crossiella]MCK2241245.1 DUF1996 domain-containing protein [Crossiella sp. S99.2]MCK2253611.1 DUF1996 domain-containing protein [Crossiella sp. S99.1]